ncbi:hypothetical protein Lal_00003549 [Lupinus albus]|nr:hypothetical protein Lal_00003549 [Lupinus albus]
MDLIPHFPLPLEHLHQPRIDIGFHMSLPFTITVASPTSSAAYCPITFTITPNAIYTTPYYYDPDGIIGYQQHSLPSGVYGLIHPFGRLTLPTVITIDTNTIFFAINVSLSGHLHISPITNIIGMAPTPNINAFTHSLFSMIPLIITLPIASDNNTTISVYIYIHNDTIFINSDTLTGTCEYLAFVSLYSQFLNE